MLSCYEDVIINSMPDEFFKLIVYELKEYFACIKSNLEDFGSLVLTVTINVWIFLVFFSALLSCSFMLILKHRGQVLTL